MKIKDLNELIEKAKSLYNSKVTVIEKDYSGKKISKTYTLIDVKPLGIGKVRDAYTEPPDDDMWYTVFAILKGEKNSDQIDIFPLKIVIEAIQEEKALARNYFDN